ncbi:hypothetical protein A6R68_06917, partial [Neotoma lepida]
MATVKAPHCTHVLGMSPCVPMTISTLPPTPEIRGLSSLTRASPVPSSSLQKDDGSCLYTQGTLELNTSAQGSQEHSSSNQVSGHASLHAKATLGQPRLSDSTKNVSRHVPFLEGDIRYPLSELDRSRSILSAKGRLTSSMYAQKGSSPTSTPQRSVPPTVSSELSFRSSSPPKEDLRCSPSPRGGSRHSKLKKTKSRHASKEAGLKSVPSEDGGLKVHHSSRKGDKDSLSDKGAVRLKTEPKESLTTSSAKGDCRSSQSHDEGHRSSPSPQGVPRHSKSTKNKLEKAPSDKADVHASHSECGGSNQFSLLKRGPRHSLSPQRDQKPKPTPQENIEPFISTEGGMGTTPPHEENLRHSTSPHGTSSHTTCTSTKTRLRYTPYTQEAIKTSPAAQECCNSSIDGDSPNGSVTPSSSHGQKPLTNASEGRGAVCPVHWGLMYSPVPKSSVTSFPVVQGKFRHTLSLLADMRSSLYYQRMGATFPYEYGDPICDPSVLGGHRYSHSMSINLKRIPRQRGSWSSNLSPQGGSRPSQCDQSGLRLSYGHLVQGSLTMFLSEKESLKHIPSNRMSLRCAPSDQREFRDVPSNQEWARTSTSALGNTATDMDILNCEEELEVVCLKLLMDSCHFLQDLIRQLLKPREDFQEGIWEGSLAIMEMEMNATQQIVGGFISFIKYQSIFESNVRHVTPTSQLILSSVTYRGASDIPFKQ